MAIEEIAEEVVNEVATNLEEAAEITRKINAAGIGYFAVGLGVGAAIGFYFGYKFNREKIRAEAFAQADDEIEMIREIYQTKMLASEEGLQGVVPTEKPPVEEVVNRLGYHVEVPERERPLPAPVPILDDLPENPVPTSKSMNAGWNYEQELLKRSPDEPYIIHQNEYNHSNLNYSKVQYNFYAVDGYLVDPAQERPVLIGPIDTLVGNDNFKFGHGSDDSEVVYVRNDARELDMMICRIKRSYEEEELGLDGPSMEDDDDDDDDS